MGKVSLDGIRFSALLLSGARLPSLRVQRDAPVSELRRRTAAALGRPPEQVLLVGGAHLLPGTWTLREAFGAVEEAEVSVVLTESMGPAEEVMDPSEPSSEYARDFFARLREVEHERWPGPCDWSAQPEINAKMRSILVDWLVDVQFAKKLPTLALFLAVSILDRFLARRTCSRKELQLLGVASFSLAEKILDESRTVRMKDWAYLTDFAYTPKQVSDFETKVLNTLNFQVLAPTALQFLELHERASGLCERGRQLALYLLELALVGAASSGWAPSHLSAAAVLLAHESTSTDAWPEGMSVYSGCSSEALRPCAEELRRLHKEAKHSKLQAVRQRFSKPAHGTVATMVL